MLRKDAKADNSIGIFELFRSKQYKPAYLLIEDMKVRIPKVNVVYYVNIQTIRYNMSSLYFDSVAVLVC